MTYIQNYIDHSEKWTNQDLKNFLKNCTTSFHVEGPRIQFRECAILDAYAQPIPIDEFMLRSGQRVMLQRIAQSRRPYSEVSDLRRRKARFDKKRKLLTAPSLSSIKQLIEMSNAINQTN